MRVLITGGSGFVGGELIAQLKNLSQPPSILNIDLIPSHMINTHIVDVTDRQKVLQTIVAFRPNIIYHLAAIHYIPYCMEHPTEAKNTNVIGTQNILEAATMCQQKPLIIFASSAAVYTPLLRRCIESDELRAIDIYGQSKIDAEALCQKYAYADNLHIIAARFANIFGRNDTTPHIIPKLIDMVGKDKTLYLGDMTPERDFIHVSDIAAFLIKAASQTKCANIFDTVNVSTGIATSISETVSIVQTLLEEAGLPKLQIVTNSPENMRKTDRIYLCLDNTKAKNYYEWDTGVDLREGIKDLLVAHEPTISSLTRHVGFSRRSLSRT